MLGNLNFNDNIYCSFQLKDQNLCRVDVMIQYQSRCHGHNIIWKSTNVCGNLYCEFN